MAKFTFRLQTVLEHKQRLQELAQLEHAQAQATQLREESALACLVRSEQQGVTELERQRFTGRLDMEALQLGMAYLDALKIQLQLQEQVVERVRRLAEAKREQLVTCMQDRKALERLRDRQQAAFGAEQRRREAVEQDDLVVMRHARTLAEAKRVPRMPEAVYAGR